MPTTTFRRRIRLIPLASVVVVRVAAKTCDASLSYGPIPDGGCASCVEIVNSTQQLDGFNQSSDFCYPDGRSQKAGGLLPLPDGKIGCCYTMSSLNQAGNCVDLGDDDYQDPHWYCGCISGPTCERGEDSDDERLAKLFVGLAVSVGIVLMAMVYLAFFRKRRAPHLPIKSETSADTATARHPLLGEFGEFAPQSSYLIDQDDLAIERDGLIGRGAEGFVMRGKFNGATVAVKVVTMGMTTLERDTIVSQATKEVQLLQQLHHPNIVQLFGMSVKVASLDTKIMLVMECCMCSLQQHLKDATIPIMPIEVLGFLLDISSGMLHLHANDFIHRDLKPGNVLLVAGTSNSAYRFTAKVADFGCSRFVLPGTDIAAVSMTAGLGTPAYQAPESDFEGVGKSSQYSKNVDVYSFALTAWACVNRETPYADNRDSPWELRAKIAAGTRPAITSAFEAYPVAADQQTDSDDDASFRLTICTSGGIKREQAQSEQFDLDLANTKGAGLSSFGESSVVSLSSLEAIRLARDTTLRSLVDIVMQGWRSRPEQRPSFEQTTPVLEVLFRMATRKLAAEKAAGSKPRAKRDIYSTR
jgi:serine/threonine protein kinase